MNQIILFFVVIIFFIFCFFNNNNNLKNVSELDYNLKLVEDFSNNLIKFNIITKPNKTISKFKTFYNQKIFPELKTIDYHKVLTELNTYIKTNNLAWTQWVEYDLWKTNSNTNWTIIPLMAFGLWSKTNVKLFPQTVSELGKIPNLVSAGFSKLGPNTTLKLHKGWGNLSNNVLRCHLGLSVPKLKCQIFVLGESNDTMYQSNGKWIIFDDSLYHSANNSDELLDRIVLILDIKRPEYIPKGISDIEESEELKKFISEFNKL